MNSPPRILAVLDAVRSRIAGRPPSEGRGCVDTGADADGWLLAVYDAALAELCDGLGVPHSLLDDGVGSERERQRVELELLSWVLSLQ